MAFSPDGKSLAGAGDDTNIHLWNAETGQLVTTLREGHQEAVHSLCWLNDGETLGSGSDSEVCIWDTNSGRLLRTLPGKCDALSLDGRLVAGRGESIIRLRSLDNNRPLRTIVALRDSQYAVVSPDGHYRGPPGVEDELVYVVQTDQGQETLTPEDFSNNYHRTNDPKRLDEN